MIVRDESCPTVWSHKHQRDTLQYHWKQWICLPLQRLWRLCLQRRDDKHFSTAFETAASHLWTEQIAGPSAQGMSDPELQPHAFVRFQRS